MLLSNADDWGRSRAETDAILRCHAWGTVSSVSAMVFMADSERAADLAKAGNFAVGFHLNLTERFSATAAPIRLRECQERIARHLKRNKYALLVYHPFLRKEFQYVYQVQAEEFLRCYGQKPEHFDGHQHMHLCSNMLLEEVIPCGERVRRSFSFRPGEKGVFNRTYRGVVDRWLRRRYRLTDFFFSLQQCLKANQMDRVMDLSRVANVELMSHPIYPQEQAWLLSENFLESTRACAPVVKQNSDGMQRTS